MSKARHEMNRAVETITAGYRPRDNAGNTHTPTCTYCEQSIDLIDDATCLVPGQWMMNRELGHPVFVLDPDVPLQIIQLPNGQMAISTDDDTSRHAHTECLEQVKAEVLGYGPGHEMFDDEEEFYR